MTQQNIILKSRSERSESTGGAIATGFSGLSPEIQKEAKFRLGWTALVYALGYLLAFGIGWIIEASHRPGFVPRTFEMIVAAGSILLGLTVSFLCRKRKLHGGRAQALAFWFEVLGSVGICANLWGWEGLKTPEGPLTGIPWVCVWILIFPVVMPSAPRKTLLAGVIAAFSGPLVMLLSVWLHGMPEGWQGSRVLYLIAFLQYPALITAAVAYWTAILFFQLSREASRARRLGSYQLVEKIGSGGMGEVWRAKHRLLVRPAAIKLIRAPISGADPASQRTAIKRFEREAQATALLTSPHTVEVYDFGLTEDGVFYYVMEFLDGLDLKRMVERHGPLPEARVVHLLRQICHSLADAHLAGMVHRDIKPANIVVCRRGTEYDFVKVLDFGLVAAARDPERQVSQVTQLTMEGIVSGTPAFMAPEMASGERPADSRADIYAVGCVAYWLLTGQLVFEGATPMSVLLKHAGEAPPPPSVRTEMPILPDLERLILDCLQKDPDRRPATGADLARSLAACQMKVGEWTEERAEKWWRLNRPEMMAQPLEATFV